MDALAIKSLGLGGEACFLGLIGRFVRPKRRTDDPGSPANRAIVATADERVAMRKAKRSKFPLKVTYYQAESAKVWG
jgi:hypothetical protein